ncbi:hypothetical protein MHYP_G00058660 [Metynnis hypsauchen]
MRPSAWLRSGAASFLTSTCSRYITLFNRGRILEEQGVVSGVDRPQQGNQQMLNESSSQSVLSKKVRPN